jgi:hypothetical protein
MEGQTLRQKRDGGVMVRHVLRVVCIVILFVAFAFAASVVGELAVMALQAAR